MKHQLSDEIKMFIARRWAEYCSMPSIVRAVKDKFDRDISTSTVDRVVNYQPKRGINKYRKFADQIRAEFDKGIADQKYSNKRVRLEKLENIADAAFKEGRWHDATAALKAARDEIEGSGETSKKADLGELLKEDWAVMPPEEQFEHLKNKISHILEEPFDDEDEVEEELNNNQIKEPGNDAAR